MEDNSDISDPESRETEQHIDRTAQEFANLPAIDPEPQDSTVNPDNNSLSTSSMSNASNPTQSGGAAAATPAPPKCTSFGVELEANATPIKTIREEVLVTKDERALLKPDAKLKILDRIKAEQQAPFHSIGISSDDPNGMMNAHSLVSLLTQNKSNLKQCDLLDPCTIALPEEGAFDDSSPAYRTLKANGSAPETCDLFTAHMKLTAAQVADSSKWHVWFLPADNCIQEDLSWSLAHCKKNVKDDLHQKVCTRMQKFKPMSHGGPLFLKMLLEQVSTTGEASLRALVKITETHSIKRDCPGEDIPKVTGCLDAICTTMDTIRDGVLPADGLRNLFRMLQTTGVPPFNAQFEKKEIDCENQDIQRSIDPQCRFSSGTASDLENDLRTAQCMLAFADRHCGRLQEPNVWSKHTQGTSSAAAFMATDGNANDSGNKPEAPPSTWESGCFNCGQKHHVDDCPFAPNAERIKANEALHPTWIGHKKRNEICEPPKPHENGRRVIEGKPHRYDPHGGRNKNGRWIPETAPGDGQPNNGAPPQVHHQTGDVATKATAPPSIINLDGFMNDASTIGTAKDLSEADKAKRKLNLHLMQAKINEQLSLLLGAPLHLALAATRHTLPSFCGGRPRRRPHSRPCRRRLALRRLAASTLCFHSLTGDLPAVHSAFGLTFPTSTRHLQISHANARFTASDLPPASTPHPSTPSTTADSFPATFDVLDHASTLQDLTLQFLPEHHHQVAPGTPLHSRAPIEAKSLQAILSRCNETMPLQAPLVHSSGIPNELPIVADTGASCSVTPRGNDFATEPTTPDTNRMEGPNGQCAEAVGAGPARWDTEDARGMRDTIQTHAHFVPAANVRSLSPQVCLMEQQRNGNAHCQMVLTANDISSTLANGTVLSFPIQNESNSPTMLAHQASHKSNADTPTKHAQHRHVRKQDRFANSVSCLLSSTFNTFDSQAAFANATDTPVPHKIADGPAVLAETNWNLTPAQKELLLWHHRLGHMGMDHAQTLLAEPQNPKGKRITQPSNDKSSHCDEPLCKACQHAKQKRRNPPSMLHKSRQDLEGALSQSVLFPGQKVSVDLCKSSSRGRLPHAHGKEKDELKHTGGAIFIDHATRLAFAKHQLSTAASETVLSKHAFELFCDRFGVQIKQHVADNNPFQSTEWTEDCARQNQELTALSGVGAHHQIIAERYQQTVFSMARAMMTHFALHWPQAASTDLWPFAVNHAIHLWNHTPRARSSGAHLTRLSPLEHFTSAVFPNFHHLQRLHVFGCPVHALDPRLQDGKKIPKWERRSRRAIHLGCGQQHSTTVHLVLSPDTGQVSPQCHVVFDDTFSTVFSDGSFTQDAWDSLLVSNIERHPDADSAPDLIDFGDNDSVPEREFPQTQPPPQPQGAPAGAPTVHFRDDPPISPRSTPSTLTPETVVTAPPPAPALTVPEGDGLSSSPISVPEGASSSPEGDAPAPLRRSTRVTRPPDRLTLHANSPNPSGSQQVTFAPSNKLPCVPGERLNQQCSASLPWDNLLTLCQNPKGTFGSFVSEHGKHRSHSKLTECLDPALLATMASKEDTPTFKEAMASPDQAGSLKAMRTEVDALTELDVHDLVDQTPDMKATSSAWAFKRKRFPDGSARKLKARFCARGFEQEEGVDCFETFAPVVMWMTVRLLPIMSIPMNSETKQIDCTAAFVHAAIDCVVCVQCPKSFEAPGKVWKLKKSLCGLAQSPRNFFLHAKNQLEQKLGFVQSTADPCLFTSPDVICLIHVDDAPLFHKDEKAVDNLTDRMNDLEMQFREEETVAGFLGVHTERKGEEIHLTQSGLIERILTALHSDDSSIKPVETPSTGCLPIDADGEPAHGTFSCPSAVGQPNCLQGHSRPDITMATSQVARFVHNPRHSHELALIQIGGCLKGTMEKGIILRPEDTKTLSVDLCVDAAFACGWNTEQSTNPDAVKSRTGHLIEVAGCPALWVSKLQSTIATSAMEAECAALSMALRAFIPLLSVIESAITGPSCAKSHTIRFKATVHEDNQGALILASLEPGRHTVRSKFCALRLHWLRSWVHNPDNSIETQFIDAAQQKADFLTKSLSAGVLRTARRQQSKSFSTRHEFCFSDFQHNGRFITVDTDQENDAKMSWALNHGPAKANLRLACDVDSVHHRLKELQRADQAKSQNRTSPKSTRSKARRRASPRACDPIFFNPGTNFLEVEPQNWMGGKGKTRQQTERGLHTHAAPNTRFTRNSDPAHR